MNGEAIVIFCMKFNLKSHSYKIECKNLKEDTIWFTLSYLHFLKNTGNKRLIKECWSHRTYIGFGKYITVQYVTHTSNTKTLFEWCVSTDFGLMSW